MPLLDYLPLWAQRLLTPTSLALRVHDAIEVSFVEVEGDLHISEEDTYLDAISPGVPAASDAGLDRWGTDLDLPRLPAQTSEQYRLNLLARYQGVGVSVDGLEFVLNLYSESTALSAAAGVGAGAIAVFDTTQAQPGATVVIGNDDQQETHAVVAASSPSGPGTLTLATPLTHAQPQDGPVWALRAEGYPYTINEANGTAAYWDVNGYWDVMLTNVPARTVEVVWGDPFVGPFLEGAPGLRTVEDPSQGNSGIIGFGVVVPDAGGVAVPQGRHAWSVRCWIRRLPLAPPNTGSGYDTNREHAIWSLIAADSTQLVKLFVDHITYPGALHLQTNNPFIGPGDMVSTPGLILADGVRHLVTYTYAPDEGAPFGHGILYVDGVNVGSSPSVVDVPVMAQSHHLIGQGLDPGTYSGLNAELQELAFFNVTLSPAEEAAYFANPAPMSPTDPTLNAYFKFAEGAGSTTTDAKNGLVGTLSTGAPGANFVAPALTPPTPTQIAAAQQAIANAMAAANLAKAAGVQLISILPLDLQ